MASAQRVPLIEREITEKLGAAALELLFADAERISEGSIHQGRYFGSTMLTIDLAKLANRLRVDHDNRIDTYTVMLAEDARVTRRIHRLAERDATSRANAPLSKVSVEVRVRADGQRIFLDADVEATLRDS